MLCGALSPSRGEVAGSSGFAGYGSGYAVFETVVFGASALSAGSASYAQLVTTITSSTGVRWVAFEDPHYSGIWKTKAVYQVGDQIVVYGEQEVTYLI